MVEVLAAMSEVYMYQTLEFDKALEYFKKTLELNPNRAATHYHYSWALWLIGDREGALKEHELAVKYDPLNPYYIAWFGGLYAFYGEYDKAFQELTNASLIFEDYYLCYSLGGYIYREMGRYDEALKLHIPLAMDLPWMAGTLGVTYAAAGQTEKAQEIIDQLKADLTPYNAYFLCAIYTALGDMDEAFNWLFHEPRYGGITGVVRMPNFRKLREDPRYAAFEASLNIPRVD
jgi:tetratricopeptide (TPR) repeat protein